MQSVLQKEIVPDPADYSIYTWTSRVSPHSTHSTHSTHSAHSTGVWCLQVNSSLFLCLLMKCCKNVTKEGLQRPFREN